MNVDGTCSTDTDLSGATLSLSSLEMQAISNYGEGAIAAIKFLRDGILWCQEHESETATIEEEGENAWERRVACFDRISSAKSLKALDSQSGDDVAPSLQW